VTEDLDVTLLTQFGQERKVIEEILDRFQSRNPDPVPFALQFRILLLQDVSGSDIDISLGGLPYEERVVERASSWGIPGSGQITTCCAEDLVVLKTFANRPMDWIDVENVLVRQGPRLNRELIVEELKPLVELKEEPEILTQLEQIFQKHCS